MATKPGPNVDAIGAALAREQFRLVVAAGGDGTVAEVMAAAYGRTLPVGIVPRGTANVVARELRLPRTWRAALRYALERFPQGRRVDLARVNDGYSVLAAGMGFDVSVMRHTPPVLKYWLGRMAYLLAGAWWLPRAPLFDCTIRAEGAETTLEAVAVLVVNAGMLGAARFRFGPGIALDDGWLDLCVYQPRSLSNRLAVLGSLVAGRQDSRTDIIYRKVRSAEIKAPNLSWYEVDGDVHRGNVLRVEILPGGISVVA